jgi:hypothetical protein
MKLVSACLLLLFYLGISGCGGSNMTNPGPTFPTHSDFYEIAGTSNSGASFNFTLNGSLTFSGNNITGVMHISNSPCFSFNTDIPVTGSTGTNSAGDFTVELHLILPSGQTLFMPMIHPGGHGSIVAGTYLLTGAGCATPDAGSASGGTSGFTGRWIGSFASISGKTFQGTLDLTQTGPDAHGFFSATGAGTITGGTCFSAVTVDPSTVFSGPGSQIVLNNSQAGTTGKTILHGTVEPGPFGSMSLTGTYTSTQGSCSDSGSVSVQLG